MKLALSASMFPDDLLDYVIEHAAELGYEGVELAAVAPQLAVDAGTGPARQIRKLLDRNGLACPCLSTYSGGYSQLDDVEAARQLEVLQRYAGLARELGAPMIRQWSGGPDASVAEPAAFDRAAAWLQRAADLLAPSGIALVVETVPGSLCSSLAGSHRLLTEAARPTVGLLLDAANLFSAGWSITRGDVALLRSHVRHVHVKDVVTDDADEEAFRPGERYRSALIGEGLVDHRPVVAALHAAGFHGFLTVEGAADDPVAAARHNLGVLRLLLAELA